MSRREITDELAGFGVGPLASPEPEEEHGNHWSLLVIDCTQDVLVGHYFDSWRDGYGDCPEVGNSILQGVGKVRSYFSSDDDASPDTMFLIAPNTPDQYHDNTCKRDGLGACGPFVWAMAKEWIQYIIDCKTAPDSPSQPIDFTLPADFADHENWDSAVTRRTILGLIQREKRVRKLLNEGRTAWWDEGGEMGWKNWIRELGVGEEWVWCKGVGMCLNT